MKIAKFRNWRTKNSHLQFLQSHKVRLKNRYKKKKRLLLIIRMINKNLSQLKAMMKVLQVSQKSILRARSRKKQNYHKFIIVLAIKKWGTSFWMSSTDNFILIAVNLSNIICLFSPRKSKFIKNGISNLVLKQLRINLKKLI